VFAAGSHVVTQMEKAGTLTPSNKDAPQQALELQKSSGVAIEELQGPPGPFRAAPAPIPGTVQAEDFDTGGLGVAHRDTTLPDTGNARGRHRATCVEIDACADEGGGYTSAASSPASGSPSPSTSRSTDSTTWTSASPALAAAPACTSKWTART
jgi:hypothetical protein